MPDGRYKSLVEYNEIGGDKKKSVDKKDQAANDGEEEDFSDTKSNVEEGNTENEALQKEDSKRAKGLARDEWGLFLIGGIGAALAGLVFPAWGVVFAYMIDLLYRPVFLCIDSDAGFTTFDGKTFDTCEDYWNNEADYLRDYSYKLTYAWVGIIASTLIGNMLLFYGFGAATERINQRIRDSIFVALMKQDIAYYDIHSVGTLSTRLEEDAAMMHSFSGEPIRQLTMTVASVVVGLFLSFWFMW